MNEKKTEPKSVADLMKEMMEKKPEAGSKYVKNYWQDRALQFMEKMKIPDKDRPILFRYFKRNMTLMESICSYILESQTPIKNPVGYILYEYKRRKTK